MKLLLHTCCAPCLIYPLEKLREKGYKVTGLFYNPNIHSFGEYKNRKQAVESFAIISGAEIVYPAYSPADFFRAVNLKEEKPERCFICWELRLRKTAKFAKENGFAYFSTTLLVSPYQDQDALREIGARVARDESIEFVYEDFRGGFRDAYDKAKQLGLYQQKYCGCVYSEIERYKGK